MYFSNYIVFLAGSKGLDHYKINSFYAFIFVLFHQKQWSVRQGPETFSTVDEKQNLYKKTLES